MPEWCTGADSPLLSRICSTYIKCIMHILIDMLFFPVDHESDSTCRERLSHGISQWLSCCVMYSCREKEPDGQPHLTAIFTQDHIQFRHIANHQSVKFTFLLRVSFLCMWVVCYILGYSFLMIMFLVAKLQIGHILIHKFGKLRGLFFDLVHRWS